MNSEEHSMHTEHTKQDSQIRVPGEWVQELFAPIYDFDAVVAAGRNGYKQEIRPLRATIFDPETIRDVFDRVHQRVVEAEEKQLHQHAEKEEIRQDEECDICKSSTWNSEELSSLRQVYQSAKGHLTKMKIALHDLAEHNNALEVTVIKQRKDIDELNEKVSQLTLTNQRLYIHRESLLKNQALQEVRSSALMNMWQENEKEKLQALEEVKKIHIELDTEKLLRQKLEAELLEGKQNLLREIQRVDRNTQTKHEMEINDLKEVIRDLAGELKNERRAHEASKRGLEHLRKHFSSLPLHHIVVKTPTEDEAHCIDHCSLSCEVQIGN